jgi:hypothetical protein
MNITYKKDYNSILHVYIEVDTAADYKKVDDKLYIHSEYEAEWDCKLGEWRQKEYYEHFNMDVLQGRQKVMFILSFIYGGPKAKEFIPEIENYFNEESRSFDYIDYTKRISIKDLFVAS